MLLLILLNCLVVFICCRKIWMVMVLWKIWLLLCCGVVCSVWMNVGIVWCVLKFSVFVSWCCLVFCLDVFCLVVLDLNCVWLLLVVCVYWIKLKLLIMMFFIVVWFCVYGIGCCCCGRLLFSYSYNYVYVVICLDVLCFLIYFLILIYCFDDCMSLE